MTSLSAFDTLEPTKKEGPSWRSFPPYHTELVLRFHELGRKPLIINGETNRQWARRFFLRFAKFRKAVYEGSCRLESDALELHNLLGYIMCQSSRVSGTDLISVEFVIDPIVEAAEKLRDKDVKSC